MKIVIKCIVTLVALHVLYIIHLYNIQTIIVHETKQEKVKCGEEYIPPCNRDLLSRDIVDKCYIEED